MWWFSKRFLATAGSQKSKRVTKSSRIWGTSVSILHMSGPSPIFGHSARDPMPDIHPGMYYNILHSLFGAHHAMRAPLLCSWFKSILNWYASPTSGWTVAVRPVVSKAPCRTVSRSASLISRLLSARDKRTNCVGFLCFRSCWFVGRSGCYCYWKGNLVDRWLPHVWKLRGQAPDESRERNCVGNQLVRRWQLNARLIVHYM